MFKRTYVKYKRLHSSWSHSKIYKNSYLPRKGLVISLFIMMIIILSFVPPFLTAFMKIHQVKIFGRSTKNANVNIHKVLNTQDEENNYFSNFDYDTKLAVLDNSANVNIWNCISDFVYYKPSTNEDISESVRTIGEGVPPLGYGEVTLCIEGQ